MAPNYYHILRTKEKYGYVVKSSKINVGDSRYISKYYTFVIQSPYKSPTKIINRTKKFIKNFRNILLKINDSEFNNLKMACIADLLTPYRNLDEISDFIFNNEIETNYTLFNLKDVLLETYKL